MSRIAILGSGVIGASIAYHLARAGADVLLVDRATPAAKPSASWASAGGLRSQGRHAPEQPLSLAASQRWRMLEDELDARLEVRLSGHLHVAETEEQAAIVTARVRTDSAAGIAIERVSGNLLREIAPAINETALVGAYTPGDGQAHPGLTAAAFARAAVRAGATVRFHAEAKPAIATGRVVGIDFADGERIGADLVILATGAWSVALLPTLGLDLPIRWRGLQMQLSEVAPPLLVPTVTAVGRNLSLKQGPSGQLMIGGGWLAEPVGAGEPILRPIEAHVAWQWQAAVGILPALEALRPAQVWAGAEAQAIDGIPFIGRHGPEGLYLALGFSNHGFQISPAVGDLVARDILGSPEPLLAPFAPGRQILASRSIEAFRAEAIRV
jgi:sarcosine oxidase subunit beta